MTGVQTCALPICVRVREKVCGAVDYASVEGVLIQRVLKVNGLKGQSHEVPVELVVAHKDYQGNRARFLALGRRIRTEEGRLGKAWALVWWSSHSNRTTKQN